MMDVFDEHYEEAKELVGTQYCSACFITGLIEDSEPKVVEMEVRHDHLGERPPRRDINMKCPECKATRQHGFGIESDEAEKKIEERGKRTLDILKDKPGDVDKEKLRALGYVM